MRPVQTQHIEDISSETQLHIVRFPECPFSDVVLAKAQTQNR